MKNKQCEYEWNPNTQMKIKRKLKYVPQIKIMRQNQHFHMKNVGTMNDQSMTNEEQTMRIRMKSQHADENHKKTKMYATNQD